jgi:hypothetical protein
LLLNGQSHFYVCGAAEPVAAIVVPTRGLRSNGIVARKREAARQRAAAVRTWASETSPSVEVSAGFTESVSARARLARCATLLKAPHQFRTRDNLNKIRQMRSTF